jgi:hypothetical protein
MDWKGWRRHFEDRAQRPLPEAGGPPPLDPRTLRRLARTLGVFCVGEGGEGRIAREIDGAKLPGIDDDYRASLKLMVREEGRHARILASMLAALGATPPRRSVGERLFVRLRRLLGRGDRGVRFKLLVLLAVEVVGIALYAGLSSAMPPGGFCACFDDIVADEAAHLRFHVDFFRASRQRAFRLLWWTVATTAAAAALLGHWRTLRAVGAVGVPAHIRRLLADVDAAVAGGRMLPENIGKTAVVVSAVGERRLGA